VNNSPLFQQPVSTSESELWLAANEIARHQPSGTITFSVNEYSFRVPIGDYSLQLDYRIHAALRLLSDTKSLLLFRRAIKWRIDEVSGRPLDVVLRAMGFVASDGAFQLVARNIDLAYSLVYLTNRWGSSEDGLYIIPQDKPDTFLYVPGSPESLFCSCRTLDRHHECVDVLRRNNVPAFGLHVMNPLQEPLYQDISVGSGVVRVDRRTGKPIGPGSPESILSPEYLPPPYDAS
jgi:hypothetical protein